MIKSAVFFAILFLALVYSKHDDHAKDSNDISIRNPIDERPYPECVITGYYYCHGKAAGGYMPKMKSVEWPGREISSSSTAPNGSFLISTMGYHLIRQPVQIIIRHLCEIEQVPLSKICAFSFWVTSITVDQRNKTRIHLPDIHIEEQYHNTLVECL